MKKFKSILFGFVFILGCATMVACVDKAVIEPVIESSIEESLNVNLTREEKIGITFELSADDLIAQGYEKFTLGDALNTAGIINDSDFFNEVNGIKCDWDTEQLYWAFYINGEYAMTGVGSTLITPGDVYSLIISE